MRSEDGCPGRKQSPSRQKRRAVQHGVLGGNATLVCDSLTCWTCLRDRDTVLVQPSTPAAFRDEWCPSIHTKVAPAPWFSRLKRISRCTFTKIFTIPFVMDIQDLLAPTPSPVHKHKRELKDTRTNDGTKPAGKLSSTLDWVVFEGPRLAKVHDNWTSFREYLADYCSANDVQIGIEFTVSVKKRNKELAASKRSKAVELLPEDLESFRRTYVCRLGRKNQARGARGRHLACPFRFTVTSVKRQGQWKVEITRCTFRHKHTHSVDSDVDVARAGKYPNHWESRLCHEAGGGLVLTSGINLHDVGPTATTNATSLPDPKVRVCGATERLILTQIINDGPLHSLAFASTRKSPVAEKSPAWFIAANDVEFDTFDDFSRGSCRKVYCGSWSGSQVAVKKVKVENKEDQAAFLEEVDIWYRLRHPHIVHLFGACHVGQSLFVCEYMAWGPLKLYLHDHQVKMWEKLHEVALGLQYLHGQGVVYGLVNCQNVLVDSDGRAKLSDFSRSTRVADSGAKLGGIVPEWLRGEQMSTASDVYSFGVCILEVLTVTYPSLSCGVSMPGAAIKSHMLDANVLPMSCPEAFDAFDALVKQMCQSEPNERPSMKEVVDKLKQLSSTAKTATSCISSLEASPA